MRCGLFPEKNWRWQNHDPPFSVLHNIIYSDIIEQTGLLFAEEAYNIMKLQELTIKSNFMFGAVMVNPDNCRRFLQMILGIEIESLQVIKEKTLIYHPEFKGVRLDITAKDENHTRYNVEMQVRRKPQPGKRTRYYHSEMDMEMLSAGHEYQNLPDSYVIFVCDFDPFHQKKYMYTFEMRCRETAEAYLEDGVHTIFLSTKGENEDEVSPEIVDFLKYVASGDATQTKNDFVWQLERSVQYIKKDREMERQYMTLEELIEEGREEGFEKGREEGLEEGALGNRIQLIRRKLDKGMAVEDIAEILEKDVPFVQGVIDLIKTDPDIPDMDLARRILTSNTKAE